ncbi:hypothetical protein LOTGIDRAFT_159072 [Lottia gigantea]|uniref:Serine protease n=1 Tax=Lottia gigantea TaxID=225164 RepID=V4AXH6_LOTGI|nr:hypothetical protein LOTGIDRAFT_159072 [Lottia gigantea]ESO98276.1 hypothetical protein LOTGIDRAFT_159072 [Lottia gigantea]
MATSRPTPCHHDGEEINPDFKIEVAHDADINKECQLLHTVECDKNPGHRGFIAFKDLKLENLPMEDRHIEIFNEIIKQGKRVVRIIVEKRRNGMTTQKLGTGFVIKLNGRYFMQTNNHVIKSEDEVKNCIVEFGYESPDRSGIFKSRGVKLIWTCPMRDTTCFQFHPEPNNLNELEIIDYSALHPSLAVIYKDNRSSTYNTSYISQKSLHITNANLNDPKISMVFLYYPESFFNNITSSYFKFQPVPPNIEELTGIEISIKEDGQNCRVIPGEIIKICDEYVIKISESISQDIVRNCRLILNGEVISHGSILYFMQIQSSLFFSRFRGVDFQIYMEQYPTCVWVFDFKPKPKGAEKYIEMVSSSTANNDNTCCIGHPHGAVKTVTFGRWLGSCTERFDNQGRQIVHPDENCQCREVKCVKYSCKTCPGSSGSPVFILRRWLDVGNYGHFMGYKVEDMTVDGKQIENINLAWTT